MTDELKPSMQRFSTADITHYQPRGNSRRSDRFGSSGIWMGASEHTGGTPSDVEDHEMLVLLLGRATAPVDDGIVDG